jgi:hypothetical protein
MPLKYNMVSSRGNYYRPTPYLYASGGGVSCLPCIYKFKIIYTIYMYKYTQNII